MVQSDPVIVVKTAVVHLKTVILDDKLTLFAVNSKFLVLSTNTIQRALHYKSHSHILYTHSYRATRSCTTSITDSQCDCRTSKTIDVLFYYEGILEPGCSYQSRASWWLIDQVSCSSQRCWMMLRSALCAGQQQNMKFTNIRALTLL